MIHLKGIYSEKREMGNMWKEAESGTFGALMQWGRQMQKKKSNLSRTKVQFKSCLVERWQGVYWALGQRDLRGFQLLNKEPSLKFQNPNSKGKTKYKREENATENICLNQDGQDNISSEPILAAKVQVKYRK